MENASKTVISYLRYATQTAESPVPVVVTNLPDSSPSWIESLSAVAGIVSLIVSGIAAVIAYRALKWSKDSWDKEGPQLKAELKLVQRVVPSSGEVEVDEEIQSKLPPGVAPVPFKFQPQLDVVVFNEGRSAAQVHNMEITFWDKTSNLKAAWYVGLNLDVAANGTATKTLSTEKLFGFLYMTQLKKISAVFGEIDGSEVDGNAGIRVELSRYDVEALSSVLPPRQ